MNGLKEKKMLLIGKCLEYLNEYTENNIPIEGNFPRHNVFFSYPGTSYEAVTWIESGSGCRYLCIGMKKSDDDRLVHHYYRKGSNSELTEYMVSDTAADDFYAELEGLKLRVDDLD